MLEASYTEEIDAPVEAVWRFVEVIPNWAPFLVGFQKLELVDDLRSIWTLRGDVGMLAREVQLQADITRWDPFRGAEFTVTGLTERITGQGTFTVTAVDEASESAVPSTVEPAPVRPPGRFRRLRSALAGRLLQWLQRRNRRRTASAASAPAGSMGPPRTPAPPAGHATGPAGGGRARLSLSLQLTPGGPMAPMIELLMTPMIEPAAEDFLRQLREALEHQRTVQ